MKPIYNYNKRLFILLSIIKNEKEKRGKNYAILY